MCERWCVQFVLSHCWLGFRLCTGFVYSHYSVFCLEFVLFQEMFGDYVYTLSNAQDVVRKKSERNSFLRRVVGVRFVVPQYSKLAAKCTIEF